MTKFCDQKEIGRRVKRARAYADLTQHDLAQQAGVSTPTLRRLESGQGGKIGTLAAILEKLNLDPRDILWEDGIQPYTRSILMEICDTSQLATEQAILDRIEVKYGQLGWRRRDGRLIFVDDDASAYATDQAILDRVIVIEGAVYWDAVIS